MPTPKAPRVVKGGRQAAAKKVDGARQVFALSVRGEPVGNLAIGNVPLSEKQEVRRQVRAAWSEVIGDAGVPLDVWNMSVFVWLARRASGEPGLSWASFQAGWDDTTRADEIDLETVDVDAVSVEVVDPQS